MTAWTYELADLGTDQTLEELPLEVQTFDTRLKGYGTCNARLSLQVDQVKALDLPSLLGFGQRVLYIKRDEQIVWSGILWRGRRVRSDRAVTLQFMELESYFAKRLWTVDYQPFATDQLDIARALTSQVIGPLRLQVDQRKSGVLRDRPTEYRAVDLRTVADLLDDLATVEGGFDYEIISLQDGQGVRTRLLRWGFPRLGRLASESGLVFASSIKDWTDEADGFASVTRQWEHGAQVGEGDLAAPLVGSATNQLALDAGVPLLEELSSEHSTVTDQATLDAWARTDLAAAPVPVLLYTATVQAGGDPPLGSYSCGDEARFELNGDDWYTDGPEGQPGLSIVLRITGWTVDVKEDTVSLELGPAYASWR